jgi:hypothetical protein
VLAVAKTSSSGREPDRAQQAFLKSGGEAYRLRFDASRATRSETIALVSSRSLSASSDVRAAVEDDLVSADDRTIEPARLAVAVHVTPSGNLAVCVALDPAQIPDLEAGTYEGALTISGRSVAPTAVPISATFRDSKRNALGWALGGFLLGAICKALSELRVGSARRGLLDYGSRPTSWIAILAGVAAAYYGFVQLYSSSRTWGAAEADGIKLLLTAALFQVSGVEGVELLKRIASSPPASPAPPGAVAPSAQA